MLSLSKQAIASLSIAPEELGAVSSLGRFRGSQDLWRRVRKAGCAAPTIRTRGCATSGES